MLRDTSLCHYNIKPSVQDPNGCDLWLVPPRNRPIVILHRRILADGIYDLHSRCYMAKARILPI